MLDGVRVDRVTADADEACKAEEAQKAEVARKATEAQRAEEAMYLRWRC